MGWQDAPIIEKNAWQDAPLVQSPTPTPIPQAAQPPGMLERAQQLGSQVASMPGPRSAIGLGEAALNMGSGLASSAVGGLAGIGTLLNGGSGDQAVENIQGIQDRLTYQPRTSMGQGIADVAAWPVEKGAELSAAAGGKLGEVLNGQRGRDAGEAIGETGFLSAALLAGKPWRMGAKKPATKAQLEGSLAENVKKGLDKSDTISRTGLNTEGQIQKAYKDATGAVESIIKNKDELVYSDFAGELSKGKLPKNLTEFSQSIAQLKKTVFKAYNDMVKKASGKGVQVSQESIIAELESIIKDPTYLQHSREMVNYAQKKLNQLDPFLTAEEAQKAIAMYNDRLKAFGKNPHPDGVGTASVDTVIRSHLRKNLDDIVTSAEGEGYAGLKKEYGNLSSIEEAVNKRRLRDDHTSGIDTANIYDVISAHDFVTGTITANPVQIGKAGLIAALSKGLKMGKDPNRAVAKMFKNSEKTVGQLKDYQPPSLTRRFDKRYAPVGMSLGARLSQRD